MHFLHPSSLDCCKSELDLFTVLPTQTSILESNFISINPVNSVTNADVPVEFHIPGNSEHYLDPSNIFLYLKVKLVNEDGTDLSGDDHIVYPTSNFLYSCFNQLEVFLNEVSLGSSAANYPFRTFIETLLNFSEDAKYSHLQSTGFYSLKDESKIVDAISKRSSKVHDFYGRLNGDIFSQDRLLLPAVDVRVRLSRSAAPFALNVHSKPTAVTQAPSPIFQIQDAYLYVRKVKLSAQRHMEIEKSLITSTAKYPVRRVETKIFNFATGLTTINLSNVVMGQLPQKLIVGMVEHAAFAGNYKKNPYKIAPFGLRELSLHVNGQPYGRPYKTLYNNGEGLCARAFYDLIANTVSCSDIGTGINKADFSTNTNLYAFDLTADLTGNAGSHLNVVKHGTLGLTFTFEKPLTSAISIIVYMEYQHLVEIDRVRNILLSY